MCGIYGYIGNKNAYDMVVQGLSLLQYRGYDSCGIAYFNDGFQINKAVGTLNNLDKCDISPTIAFGHTRWATNGVVNKANAHPHVSYNGEYTIVHNGIIKNADKIKQKLINNGITFYSDTDTEVIANYLTTIDIKKNIENIFNDLEGTFSLIIGNSLGDITLIKQFSPLHLVKTDSEIYISSDISSLPSGELYTLQDKDIIRIEKGNITSINPIKFKPYVSKKEQLNLGEHNHYMIKEIYETPEAIKNTYYNIKDINIKEIFRNYSKFTLLGCGTAYNSCLIGEYLFENNLDLDVNTFLASNYNIKKQINENHLHIIVSQSGETADCIKVAESIKDKNGKILAITNEPTSTIANIADYVILSKAKKELAVASTKTYCCQVFIFAFICQKLLNDNYGLDIDNLVADLSNFMNNINIEPLANKMKDLKHLIMIGKDIDYLTLMEASLKIREIDYIYTLPMFSSELKHGTLSLIEKGSLVLTLNSSQNKDILKSTINEICSRHGEVVEISNYYNEISFENLYKPIFTVIPFQLLSYKIAVLNGRNPDMPRNLAKSVTVE